VKTDAQKVKSHAATVVKRFLSLVDVSDEILRERLQDDNTLTTTWFNSLGGTPFYLEAVRLFRFRFMDIFFGKLSQSPLIDYWFSHKENYPDKPGVLVFKVAKFKNWIITDLQLFSNLITSVNDVAIIQLEIGASEVPLYIMPYKTFMTLYRASTYA
jgi:hypothetical protein